MTKHECAVIMAFTGVVMLKGDDLGEFYKYVAEIMGRPIYSHEIGILAEEIKEKARADFLKLCETAAKPKTNGDRIRQMTDEELADFFTEVTDHCSDGWECDQCPLNECDNKCSRDGMKVFFGKEVTEDAGTD